MKRRLIFAAVTLVVLVLLGGPLIASASFRGDRVTDRNPEALPAPPLTAGYAVSWWTVDGGGGTSNNSGFALNGTIGQPDAGSHGNTGYVLVGGYWSGVSDPLEDLIHLFLPLIQK